MPIQLIFILFCDKPEKPPYCIFFVAVVALKLLITFSISFKMEKSPTTAEAAQSVD